MVLATCWLLAAVTWLGSAGSPADQAAAAVSAPVVRSDTDVPYPAGGKGDAAVSLELVVAPDGTVSEATVLEGPEPFATQARTAVLGWQFTPARRGTEPVAVRIR